MNQKVWKLLLEADEYQNTLISTGEIITGSKMFDVIVYDLRNKISILDLVKWLESASKHLNSDGKLCISFHNKYSYEKLFRNLRSSSGHTLRRIKDLLKRTGYENIRIYNLYFNAGRLNEIIMPGKHVLVDEVVTLRDLIKYKIKQKTCFANIQPAYAVIAAKDLKKEKSLIEMIIEKEGIKNFQGFLVGKPNTIIILSEDVIIRIPLDRLSQARCKLGRRMLNILNKTGIASYVPRDLGINKFKNQIYFIESRLPGSSISAPLKRLDELTTQAAAFITAFHVETAKDIIINEPVFEGLFGKEFRKLELFMNNEDRPHLKNIEEVLRKRLIGRPFKTVWAHGDYKIENVLFDKNNWNITGVIDWDLANTEGLPLIDVIYLLLYNAVIRNGSTTTRTFFERFFNKDFTLEEKETINKYLLEMQMPEEYIMPMLIMFWLNHIVYRLRQQLISREKWFTEMFCEGIKNIEKVYNV